MARGSLSQLIQPMKASRRWPSAVLVCGFALCAALAPRPAAAAGSPITEFTIPTANSHPVGIVTGGDRNLWFTEETGDKIGRVTPAGDFTEFPLPSPFSYPMGIAAGTDGNVWYTDDQYGAIGRITPDGTFKEFSIPTPQSAPQHIVADAFGNLWFTETLGNKIGRLTTDGVFSEFPIPTLQSDPGVITGAFDGSMWFTESAAIGRITGDGVITEFPIRTPYAIVHGLAPGPDGNLWFTEWNGNKIGRITSSGVITEFPLPGPYREPDAITAGPDLNLWFTERSGKIGRITTAGQIAEFDIPTPNSNPRGIFPGPDHKIWFTEYDGNKIGFIVPDGTAPTLALPADITVNASSSAGAVVNYQVTATDPDNSDSELTVSCEPPSGSNFATGTTPVNCTASDPAGNTSEGSFSVTVVDQTAPSLVLPDHIAVNASSAAGAVVNYSVTATDPDNKSTELTISCSPASGSTFPLGATMVACKASDPQGNTDTGSFAVTVVDATVPTLSLPHNMTANATSSAGASVDYTVTATDPDNPSAQLTISCAPPSGSTFPLGATLVSCTASDPAGNTASGAFTVTVIDQTPPSLALPSNMTVNTSSAAGVVVNYTVGASDPDNTPSELTITCSAPSGSTFAPGATTVTCAASDPSRNTAIGSFTITVVIPTSTSIAASANPGQVGQPVTYTATLALAPTGGSVDFIDNGLPIAGCSAVALTGASASCTVIYGSPASHNIVAAYSGSGNYLGSTSSGLGEVITKTACATLAGCNLHATTLTNGNLAGANLSGANLSGANLSGANLSGANLTGANLANANLTGANLAGAVTTGANFNRATWSNTVCPDGTNSNSYGGTCVGHL